MAKKPTKSASNEPKPITIIVNIFPPRKDKRRVVVSAAPEGEMPVLFEGLFPDRHALLDQAFAAVLKRDPQIVTVKESTPKAAEKKSKAADDDDAEQGGEEVEESVEASDQLVTVESAESNTTSDEDLPEIEGDASSDEEAKFEAQLSDISSTEIETDEEVGNDGEQD